VVTVEDGRTLLRVGGVIQSVAVDEHYESDIWDAMIPDRRPGSVLILGMGGGTLASLLARRYAGVPTLGVERDARIARLARGRFGLDRLAQVQVLEADAFEFVETCGATFDLVCVDLYVGGRMEHGVLGAAFLRQIARLLAPDGTAVFNLWSSKYLPDQLRRVERVLQIENVREVGQNVLVHCTARPFVAIMNIGSRRADTSTLSELERPALMSHGELGAVERRTHA
jgi:spermidine synthase